MIGTPNSASISRPMRTSFPATRKSFSRTRWRDSLPDDDAQSRSDTPSVMARTSSLWRMNMSRVSWISTDENIIRVPGLYAVHGGEDPLVHDADGHAEALAELGQPYLVLG